ncbi:MAG: shikimate dehydrogenase [Candidatus Methanospirareceae archaeon]
MKEIYGVIGDPIEHSLSPVMHNAVFKELNMDAIYLAFRVPREKVKEAIVGAKSLGFSGLNVTIPLKEEAIKFVKPDELAKEIGAINTIDFSEDPPRGYNTDGIGAKRALEEEIGEVKGKNVLMLGAGGAAKAIAFYLKKEGAKLIIANRTEERGEELAKRLNAEYIRLENVKSRLKEADVLINATSVGMFPDDNATLVTADMMHPELVVFDIVYNPLETRLMREAKKAGVKCIIDGVKMLVYQGAVAFKIWTGKEAPVETMERAVREALLKEKQK